MATKDDPELTSSYGYTRSIPTHVKILSEKDLKIPFTSKKKRVISRWEGKVKTWS